MASKPFHTSTKEPVSMKLRGLNTSKKVTRQLEIDSRRMEERLRELKLAMNREKQERERQGSAGSGGIWSSGKPGALTTHGNELVKKKSPTKPAKPGEPKVRKIKVLKDTPIEVPNRAPKKYPAGEPMASVRKSFSGPACGQCEERAVALTCMECGENYCAGCFAKFHLKGALRQHRSIPYQPDKEKTSPHNSIAASNSKPSVTKTSSSADSHSMSSETKVIIPQTAPPANPSPGPGGKSLFDGEYNEEESAASFAAALAEWRQAKKGGQQIQNGQDGKKSVHDMGSGTSAVDNSDKRPVEINFHDNEALSYADRLLLKKHRRTELPSALSPTPSQLADHYLARGAESQTGDTELTNGHYNPSEEELEMAEEHQRYADMFGGNGQTPPAEMERPKSNVTIVEITEADALNEKDIDVQSVYSVQEWDGTTSTPSPRTTIVNSKQSDVVIAEHDDSPKPSTEMTTAGKVGSRPTESAKDKKIKATTNRPPSQGPNQKKIGGKNENRPSSQRSKVEEKKPSSTARNGSSRASSRNEIRGKQIADAKGSSSRSGKESSRKPDRAGQRSGKESARRRAVEPERPPSTGLTTLPSRNLQEISRMQVTKQHQGYGEGLGAFFTGGILGGEAGEKAEMGKEKKEPDRLKDSRTPTNELPECSYKGPSTSWRPDSSLSNHPDQPVTVFSPSPPKQSRDAKSSGVAGRKRSSIRTSAEKPIQPSAGGKSERTGTSRKASGKSGRVKAGASDDDHTIHWVLSQQKRLADDHSATSSASTLPDRSSSRIEIDGDDLTSYDDDGLAGDQEKADKETLEQLTWELASNEGRITADGRISSMSLIQDLDEEKMLQLPEEYQDLALGIVQDDGLGSGLSTPCNDLSLDRLSEEELRSDFELAADNQRYKDEVEALH
ncbi:uncharacterized protein [Diadema antillarum]|uniref:uncharacterized protein n=1 Tax=Diadema antillarum TaxID=105358 RepID=UPI003A88D0A7